jgi:hypothetical protein
MLELEKFAGPTPTMMRDIGKYEAWESETQWKADQNTDVDNRGERLRHVCEGCGECQK